MSKSEDDDEKYSAWEWIHPGDLGPILIAAVFLAATIATFIWMFSSPSPVADMFKKPAADSGEVTITLPQKK